MSLLPVSEKALQSQVVALLRLFNWTFYHSWISVRSAPGYPDICAVRPPRCIFAELKAERGRVTPAQQQWLDALGACPGVEVYVWRPDDLPTIADVLK